MSFAIASDDEILYEFGKGHPTINDLIASGFHWPKSEIFSGIGSSKINTDILQDYGLLKYLCYTTGIRGEPKYRRQAVLREAYTMQFHKVQLPREYLNEWGKPITNQRLLKLAYVIATLIRNAKQKSNPPRVNDSPAG